MEIVLYTTRRDCPLCADARLVLSRLAKRHAFSLREVDIDGDPRLAIRHALRIPVVEVDGREVAFGRIEETALETALLSVRARSGTVVPRP